MKRWHQDLTISRREWRKHRRNHVETNKRRVREVGKDPYEVDCPCDDQVGRFRKKDAWDCGNSRCYICHGDKFPKRILHEQEILADFSFKEQVRELFEERHGLVHSNNHSRSAVSMADDNIDHEE